MKPLKYIANLGYGSRREVADLFAGGHVTRRDGSTVSPEDRFTTDDILVDGEPLDPPPGVVIMLNKPTGYVCTTKDADRLIYELLPPRFPHRSPIIAPVGRLDRDTSGLLLLTDDGQLNHRLTSPRRHLSKVYEVELANDLRGDEADAFASGTMMLESETTPLQPAKLEAIGSRHARVTLTEGRYHQVRRMFAAMGNHVESLHRTAIGGLGLGSLRTGTWKVLDASELSRLPP